MPHQPLPELRLKFLHTLSCLSLILFTLPSVIAVASKSSDDYVVFRSPVNLHKAQGSQTFQARTTIKLEWDSTLTPLNCDVIQGPDENGITTVNQVFRGIANTTSSFPWYAHTLPNVTVGSPMHFYLWWAEDEDCNRCHSNTTNFYLDRKERPKSDALPIGLGVGLGVGIPLIIAAVFLTWFCMRRRNRKAAAAQSTLPSSSHAQDPYGHGTASPSTMHSHPSGPMGYYGTGGDTSGSEAKTPLAEADENVPLAELPHEAEPAELGNPSPRNELEGDRLFTNNNEK